jgi:hypothetical protein
MTGNMKIKRVVLYKHGVAYFERLGKVEGNEVINLDFKSRDMNDVLKSMTVLDLNGGTVSAVSYDSTKPIEKLLEEATIRIPEQGSLTALLGQVKGARIRAKVGNQIVEGAIVGLETAQVAQGETRIDRSYLTLLHDGALRSYDLLDLSDIAFLDETVRKDLEFYLSTLLSSYKKDSKRVAVFATGEGKREVFVSYTLETPVWKTSYRVLLRDDGKPVLQGWAVVDNTFDEDWIDVDLALIAGLPISFIHDLYSPRYMSRPVVEVKTEAAAAPVITEEANEINAGETQAFGNLKGGGQGMGMPRGPAHAPPAPAARPSAGPTGIARERMMEQTAQVKTLVKDVGDLFEYRIAQPVTVRRNQSALVPILHRPMEGRRVLLWNRSTREKNPMACIELKNTSELTLEGGPLTVTEGDLYVGEAMLDTMKPNDRRFVPFAVELGCVVTVDDATDSGTVFKSQVSRGNLSTQYWTYRRTRLRIRSKARSTTTLYIEHPKTIGWDLIETPEPTETTERYYRFKLELEAGKEVSFNISERQAIWQSYALSNASNDNISFYLSSRYIDDRIAKALREVIKLREQSQQLQEQERRLQTERQEIFKDQERIRSNMGSLSSSAEQRQLSERLVKKLSTQEDQLEKLVQEIASVQQQRAQIDADVVRKLNDLEFSADLAESGPGKPPAGVLSALKELLPK